MDQCYGVVARRSRRTSTNQSKNDSMRTRSIVSILVASGVLASLPKVTAGESPAVTTVPEETSFYDKLWGLTTLYSNKENQFLQELRFTGRAHVDLWGVDADQGTDSDLDSRRLRFGLKAKILNNFTLHFEADTEPENANPFYSRFTEAYLAWSPSKEFKLTVGKTSYQFTLDAHSSSNIIDTLERSNISNNIGSPTRYMPTISISGEKGAWLYNVGVFSNGTPSPEWGNFDASWSVLAMIGYDFKEVLEADKAVLALDLMYQEPTDEPTFSRSNESGFSLSFDYREDRFSFATEAAASTGYGSQSDLFGFLVRSGYYIVEDKLQVVGRYTYMSSDEPNGIRLGRYEREVVSGRGDDYHEFYAGLNYYIYGHKLKIMSGVTYTMMDDSTNSGGDFDGLMGVVGLRMHW